MKFLTPRYKELTRRIYNAPIYDLAIVIFASLLHESKKKKKQSRQKQPIRLLSKYGRNNHQHSRSRSWNQIRAWNRDSCTTISIDASFASGHCFPRSIDQADTLARFETTKRIYGDLLMARTTVEIRENVLPASEKVCTDAHRGGE